MSTATRRRAFAEEGALGASQTAFLLLYELRAVQQHIATAASQRPVSHQFAELAETWKRETTFFPRAVDIAMHHAYQQIIGIGKPALVFILHDLAKEPNHWFLALTAISGVNPIRPDSRGDIELMSEDWIAWGHRSGLIE